jgi:hypothetical protein
MSGKKLTEQERDLYVANEIKAGRCPFGMLKEGQSIAHCPLGFPGCGCADEMQLNPHFEDVRKEQDAKIALYFEEQEKTNSLVGKENNDGFDIS